MGSIDHFDLKDGLASIGLFATNDELSLFIKRYDTDKNGKLRFSEFSNALLSIDPYFRSIVERRSSNVNGLRSAQYYRDVAFSYGTRLELKQLFRTSFSIERITEQMRKSLNRDPFFDKYEAFKACDINEDGIVTKNEVRRMLESRGLFLSELESQMLMNKLDKDRDGRISLNEFLEEIRPQSGY